MVKPNLRYDNSNKRWTDYVDALKKERFQLFNKIDGQDLGRKTEFFDNYAKLIKNQNANNNSGGYQIPQSTNDSKAYDIKQQEHQNNMHKKQGLFFLEDQQYNIPKNRYQSRSYPKNVYFVQNQYCQHVTENHYYDNQYYGYENQNSYDVNYLHESNYMPNYQDYTYMNVQNPYYGQNYYENSFKVQNNQGMYPTPEFAMQNMYNNQQQNNNTFGVSELGNPSDPNQNSYM